MLSACALEQDLKELKHGDATELGEKGVTVSGGQKQVCEVMSGHAMACPVLTTQCHMDATAHFFGTRCLRTGRHCADGRPIVSVG